MGEKIAAFDWNATPLGDMAQWPAALKTSISMVLNSRFPMYLCWGEAFISFHNDAYAPLLGVKEALGKPFADVWPEAWDTVGPFARRALAGEATFAEDLPIVLERHGYPELTYYTFSYSPIRDENGAVGGILCTVVETTSKVTALNALKEKEEALRELNARLESEVAAHAAERDRVWRMAQDIMAVASLGTGRFLTVNPAFSAALGWTEEAATSMPFMDMVYPDDKDDVARNMLVLAAGTPLVRYETRVMHSDGSHRWLSWTIVPEGELLYGVARDITAEKHQAEALRTAEEALRQSQKMEAVGQLTGGLAHDFNNMLAGVVGNLELLKLRLGQGEADELRRRIDAALAVTERASALTHRLLAFSRRQALDPKPTDVNQLVGSMHDLILRTAGPAIQVETRLQPDIWNTLCDPNQLESALLNLAINARDAMPDGGKLVIETENIHLGAGHVRVYQELTAGEYVAVSVSDTGTGMPPEVVERAFDPFFTTKPMGQGTGLGLSMVYGFAKQSGGQVRIYSSPGKGTMVRLKLPRHVATRDENPAAAAASAPAVASMNASVLVVDDEPVVRSLLADMLQMQGMQVLQAEDAPTALKVAQSAPNIDLLVTDVGLPNGMNGRQLADIMRTHWPALPVLFITGYAENAVMKNESLPANMQILVKPFTMSALMERIKTVLATASQV
ncbi:PAS/PAC sensor hybrid histidine kinase [Noviherbaspirillum humi]|uniref:histidine kinase n=2 Tax=Noviherbaspirillum humi TaxID=1688639 RepID=A0A239I4G3_9BURK|nr:PAS/PAC sensor hybrid histidine kinase [Noviherbaspirillum humi]